MPAKRIFVLNGHPAKTSLSLSIVEAYVEGAQASGHEVRISHLSELDFDVDHGFAGYANGKALESTLEAFQADVTWAQHIVLATPMWWGGMPAKLKGLIDRTFLPGWAFDTRKLKMGKPAPLLGGRTARVFVTSDTPNFFFWLLYRNALLRQIKAQIFHFVGIKPTRISHFSPASEAKVNRVGPWLKKAKTLGQHAQ